jgi:Family of unknown function (DUF6519)
MQGDFSRRTFHPADHFGAVLLQQGRVQLDADFNEQADILLHYLRTVVADLVGPVAAPQDHAGFEVQVTKKGGKIDDLTISPGRIYVDGLLVENDIGDASYWHQPDGYLDPDATSDQLPQPPFLAYLRVWEQLITAVQQPRIRDVALGDPGPDTATRAKVVWQLAKLAPPPDVKPDALDGYLRENLAARHPGVLAARARRPADADTDPCHLPPEAAFRGPENQLYRIEIHSGGPAWADTPTDTGQARQNGVSGATFVWSRENASVLLPILAINGDQVQLATLGRDGKLALEIGDWVEITDDAIAARVADDRDLKTVQPAPPLRRVTAIDADTRTVTLSGPTLDACDVRQNRHPALRRWDHRSPTRYTPRTNDVSTAKPVASDGALPIIENFWIALEDGVEVMFTPPPFTSTSPPTTTAESATATAPTKTASSARGGRAGGASTSSPSSSTSSSPLQEPPATYRPGDFWNFPARTVTGDVEWPQDANGHPLSRPSDGVQYHYAALATVDANGSATQVPQHKFTPVQHI